MKTVIERFSRILFLVIICADIFMNVEFRPGLTIAASIFCLGFLQRFLCWVRYFKREIHTNYKRVRVLELSVLDNNFI